MALSVSQSTSITAPAAPASVPALPNSTLSSPASSSATLSPSNSTTSSLSTVSSTSSSLNLNAATAAALDKNGDASTMDTRKTEAPAKQRSKNGYVARVSFDTLDCEDTTQYAFTLQARTDGWRRTRASRTFLVGTDLNDYSAHALKWVIENMVEDGDEIVALRVVPMELRDSFAKSGVPSFQGQEIAARTEVTKIMDMIREQNKSKEINIVVECMVGNIRDTIQYMIKMYEPAMLVVGTRGRNTVKGFLLGSVSRYCLNHSPIPVTVVRPASKLKESKTKAKGIFRRRNSAVQVDLDDGTGDSPPKLFYSSPLSRETSRTSSLESSNTITSIELERRESRSPDRNSQHYHHQHQTAAAKASAAKRSVLFPPVSAPSSLSPAPSSSALNSAAAMMIPPSPAASINTSLSYASAMLSSSPPGTSSRPPPPPEGVIRMTKSMTSDGTTGPSASNKRIGGRISFPKLSGSILGPLSLGGSKDKDKDKEKKGSFLS